MNQEKEKVYLLCLQGIDTTLIYGIFNDKKLLKEAYNKAKDDSFIEVLCKERPDILELELNVIAGDFIDFDRSSRNIFREKIKSIGIEEVE